jgi:hypothetical protein
MRRVLSGSVSASERKIGTTREALNAASAGYRNNSNSRSTGRVAFCRSVRRGLFFNRSSSVPSGCFCAIEYTYGLDPY